MVAKSRILLRDAQVGVDVSCAPFLPGTSLLRAGIPRSVRADSNAMVRIDVQTCRKCPREDAVFG